MGHHEDTLFRSVDMSLVQLYVAKEIGREVVSALGELGQIQFRDLNADVTAFQRTFTNEIRRLDNVERQLRYFGQQMEKSKIPARPLPDSSDLFAAPSAAEIDQLAERCQSLEGRVAGLNDSYETLKKREVELTEWRWVLREAGGFFDRALGHTEEIRASTDNDEAPLLRDVEQHAPQQNGGAERTFSMMNIGFVAGVIPRERMGAFERILWRTLRGNLYMNQSEIPEKLVDPSTNEPVDKNVFVIFAHGKEIIAKIRKISESLGANLYSVDENTDLRREQIHEVNSRLNDLASVLSNTERTLTAELSLISRSLKAWIVVVKKEKAVFQALNSFSYDQARKTLIAEAWVPTNSMHAIQVTLRDVTDRAGLSVPSIINELRTSKTPPTYFKTNKFTDGFQNIINAYGTAKYQEVNPGLPTIITFPFLFAVMFGDVGHGFIMALAAFAFISQEKKLGKKPLDEITGMVFSGRYIMLMMGIFSIYTGALYNDLFSKSMTIFPSQWEFPHHFEPGDAVTGTLKSGYRYPFGLDWAWHGTENYLIFTNSFKMKLSICMGWAHMTYSLCLSYINARHFKTPIDIWGNFVPGMIFFQSIFGYLVFCIIYKWATDWIAIGEPAPGLLNLLIYMFLSPGNIQERIIPGQAAIQIFLLLVALIQVPILLFLKPFYLRWEHNRARAMGYRGIGEGRITRVSATDADDEDHASGRTGGRDSMASDGSAAALITEQMGADAEEHEEFDFSDVMIHQVIHTIEFCLNCISHTASYLRLWALSLAHAQLSTVLWNMTIGLAFGVPGAKGVIAVVCLFYLWFTCTIGILVLMEGLSAMLHSLRLHWVEAMSKHFVGEGIPFEPFSFALVLGDDGQSG